VVVAEPLYRGSIRGDYSPATANNRLKTVVVGRSARLVRASAYATWEREAVAWLRSTMFAPSPVGPVKVELNVWHPAQHRKGAASGLARIDVDALIKSTLDALVAAGVLYDDSLVVEVTARKHVALKSEQRIDVAVWTWEGEW
jgi:Holliday junction resolvase RusA-like endonuclease